MTGPSARAVGLQLHGPLIEVRFAMNADHEREFRAQGRPVVETPPMLGILDTGSDTTIVPPGTFRILRVPVTGNRPLRSVGVSHGLVDCCRGRLLFRGPRGETVESPVSASERGLGGTIQCLVGRDTLLHGMLSYNGREGACGLSLRGVEIPLVGWPDGGPG